MSARVGRRRLNITMNGLFVGTLVGGLKSEPVLTYADSWMYDRDATPLSVGLQVLTKVHRGEHLENYLWGLLPDNENVIQRWARQHGCSARDVVGLLEAVGQDVAGAAQYLPDGVDLEESLPASYRVLSEDDIEQFLLQLRQDNAAWHPDPGGRWSLAGAQAKIALAYDRANDVWSIPSGKAPTTHIIKPAIPGLSDHELNEHLCISAAQVLGLPCARTEVRRFGSVTALVVERFDRMLQGDTLLRVHQEDFCQALGFHPSLKYQSDGGPSLGEMVDLLRRQSSAPASDVDTLLLAVAYNWLVLGPDAHAKNYGLLLAADQVRLAPLYDIASLAPYEHTKRKILLAHKVGGEYRARALAVRHWERQAQDCAVDPVQLIRRIRRLAELLPTALRVVQEMSDLEPELNARMTEIREAITMWAMLCAENIKGVPTYRARTTFPDRSAVSAGDRHIEVTDRPVTS
jgi:serine/threonine-protein kinase HipA